MGNAALTIQDAVDASAAGDEGFGDQWVYASAERAVRLNGLNRVAVDQPIFLHSVMVRRSHSL